MPIRIVKQPVAVHRDGKQVFPPVGSQFEFTDAEVKEINSLNDGALGHILIEDAPTEAEKPAKAK